MASIPGGVEAIQQHGHNSCGCLGLGWLPLTEAEATIDLALAVADSQGWDMMIDSSGDLADAEIFGADGKPLVALFARPRNERRETCWRALHAAMEAKA
mgnify:FL=1